MTTIGGGSILGGNNSSSSGGEQNITSRATRTRSTSRSGEKNVRRCGTPLMDLDAVLAAGTTTATSKPDIGCSETASAGLLASSFGSTSWESSTPGTTAAATLLQGAERESSEGSARTTSLASAAPAIVTPSATMDDDHRVHPPTDSNQNEKCSDNLSTKTRPLRRGGRYDRKDPPPTSASHKPSKRRLRMSSTTSTKRHSATTRSAEEKKESSIRQHTTIEDAHNRYLQALGPLRMEFIEEWTTTAIVATELPTASSSAPLLAMISTTSATPTTTTRNIGCAHAFARPTSTTTTTTTTDFASPYTALLASIATSQQQQQQHQQQEQRAIMDLINATAATASLPAGLPASTFAASSLNSLYPSVLHKLVHGTEQPSHVPLSSIHLQQQQPVYEPFYSLLSSALEASSSVASSAAFPPLPSPFTFTSAATAASPTPSRSDPKVLYPEFLAYQLNLPITPSSSIFVRVQESRLDLVRVLITGPEDTPYANGCFFFDVHLPDYPHHPPKVKFLTTGQGRVRFNPNLYNCGKVCLSLLGTWSGPGWIPNKSTLLQVLISIQGLILVPDPYFNEPAFECMKGSPAAAAASHQYNLNIRRYTLQFAIAEPLQQAAMTVQASALAGTTAAVDFHMYPEFGEAIVRHFALQAETIERQLLQWTTDDPSLLGWAYTIRNNLAIVAAAYAQKQQLAQTASTTATTDSSAPSTAATPSHGGYKRARKDDKKLPAMKSDQTVIVLDD